METERWNYKYIGTEKNDQVSFYLEPLSCLNWILMILTIYFLSLEIWLYFVRLEVPHNTWVMKFALVKCSEGMLPAPFVWGGATNVQFQLWWVLLPGGITEILSSTFCLNRV